MGEKTKLLPDDIIIYVENPRNVQVKLLDLIFIKVVEHKTECEKRTSFIGNN